MTDGRDRGLRPSDLEDVYPPETIDEIERRGRPVEPRRSAGLRGRAAAGGLAAGLLLGVREALEPEPERPAVIEVDPRKIPDGEGVRLVLVPGAPAASRAWITSVPVSEAVGAAWYSRGSGSSARPRGPGEPE